MKVVLSSIIGLFMVSSSFAQNSNVQSAENYLSDNQLESAKKAIDLAAVNENTSQKAKTWYFRGAIYESLFIDTSKRAKHPEALYVAFDSYKKAQPLDEKNEYKDLIDLELKNLAFDFLVQGGGKLEAKNDTGAHNDFQMSMAVTDFRNTAYGHNDVDTLAMYYMGYADILTGNNLGEAKDLYQKLNNFTYNQSNRYKDIPYNVSINLTTIYLAMKDTAGALTIIKKAEQDYPKDMSFVIRDVNIALKQNKFDQAINGLKAAIAIGPDTAAALYFNLGLAYEKIGEDAAEGSKEKDDAYNNAEAALRKAVSLRQSYPDAQYSIGELFYNRAVVINKKMQKLPVDQQAQYDLLAKERDALFQKALPELEKAHQMDPKDVDTLKALKELYSRLNMMDKAKEIQQELDALPQKK